MGMSPRRRFRFWMKRRFRNKSSYPFWWNGTGHSWRLAISPRCEPPLTPNFPLADIPLQEMITKAESGRYRAKPVEVFGFEEIVEAHRAMEQGLAGGKMVVTVN